MYRHVIPAGDRRTEECPYYDMGFCKLGPNCPMNHAAKMLCRNYLLGFCPRGPKCIREHIKIIIRDEDLCLSVLTNFPPEADWVDNKVIQRIEKDK